MDRKRNNNKADEEQAKNKSINKLRYQDWDLPNKKDHSIEYTVIITLEEKERSVWDI